MDEQCLELALCKVYHAHEQCEELKLGRWRFRPVDDRTAEVDEGMDEEGSEVFYDKDGTP